MAQRKVSESWPVLPALPAASVAVAVKLRVPVPMLAENVKRDPLREHVKPVAGLEQRTVLLLNAQFKVTSLTPTLSVASNTIERCPAVLLLPFAGEIKLTLGA